MCTLIITRVVMRHKILQLFSIRKLILAKNREINKQTLAYYKEWVFIWKANAQLGLCQPNAYSV